MNLLDEAILLLQQSIAINPNLALPHINLGVALEHKGLLDKAIGEYKKAIAINPNSSHAHWCLGSVYYKKKGYFLFRMLDEAIEEFKKALAIDPNNAAAHNNLAVAYQAKNDYKLAIKHVDIATELGLTVHPALLKRLKPYR
jgi:tetratricopeptide (TPR) repeat protein